MRKFLLIAITMVATSTMGRAQEIAPLNCPPGYRCVPEDSPYASVERDRARREHELAEQRRTQCKNNAHLNDELAVGEAAQASPGNPFAVSSALATSRLYNPCQ
jgi:hypothetical protein